MKIVFFVNKLPHLKLMSDIRLHPVQHLVKNSPEIMLSILNRKRNATFFNLNYYHVNNELNAN